MTQKKPYEKPDFRELPMKGAFTIGTYMSSPGTNATGLRNGGLLIDSRR